MGLSGEDLLQVLPLFILLDCVVQALEELYVLNIAVVKLCPEKGQVQSTERTECLQEEDQTPHTF